MTTPIWPARIAGLCLSGLLLCAPAGAQAASDFTISLSASVTGDSVAFTAIVCGKGAKSGPFKVGLWFDLSTTPACGAAPDHEWSSPGVGSGICESYTHTRQTVAPGSYTATAFADYTCAVDEIDEKNNVATAPYAVKPDLSSTISAGVSGDTVTYTITVKNLGAAIASSFNVGLYFDRPAAPVCGNPAPDVVLPVAGLGANQSVPLSHVRSGVAVGSFQAWALADSDCAITNEASESNNASSVHYEVGPNLFLLAPTIGVTGSTVTYSVTVCAYNASTDAGAFTVSLWYDRSAAPACLTAGPDFTWNEPSLAQGACKTLSHVRNDAPSGSYTAWVMADPGCALLETREDDNVRSQAYLVGSPAPADLYVASFAAASNGSAVSYQALVCNQGATAAPAFSAGLLYDAASAPACSTASFDHTWQVAGLGPGLCQNLSFVRTGAPAGPARAWILVDSGCLVTETSEANNSKSADYAVGVPELTVSSFSASVSGSQVTYTVQVCNSGSAAGAFAVGVYSDRSTAPDCSTAPDHSLPVASLAPATCITLTPGEGVTGSGTRQAWAFADHLCQVAEGSETNNQRSATYGVGVDAPDLRVTNFTVTVGGTTVTYLISVCNSGAAVAPAADLGLYYDRAGAAKCGDAADWVSSLPSLPPGQCESRTHLREAVAPGNYKAWAQADVACAVGESDETNNTASHSYTVTGQAVDLAVTAMNIWVSGDKVTTIATICNQGAARAEATTVGLFVDRSAAPAPCKESPDLRNLLAALDPGKCAESTFVRQKVPAGSYTAWVLADADCALGETNETNNLASRPYTVAGGNGGDARAEAGSLPPGGEGGCGCSVPQGSGGAGLLLGLLALLGLGLRRRRLTR